VKRALFVAVAAAVALAGCGNRTAPDLFVLARSGAVPGARLTLRVSDDGLVRCNGAQRTRIADDLLLDARQIARELNEQGSRTLPPGRRSVLRYRLRLEDARVAFSDSSRGQTKAMFLTQEFTRRVARGACGLPR
jgi:hypothetical protein